MSGSTHGPDSSPTAAPMLPSRLIAAMAASQFATYAALLAPLVVSLTLRVNDLAAPDRRPVALGTVLAVGAAAALVANPVFGRLSDRTRSRFGRRAPWLLVGLLGTVSGLTIMGRAGSIVVLAVGWCVTQAFANALLAMITALVSDLIPPVRRAKATSYLGTSQTMGTLAGVAIASRFDSDPLLLLLAPAGLLVVSVPLLLASIPRAAVSDQAAEGPARGVGALVATFTFDPRRHPDFGWTWLARFLTMYALASLNGFQALFASTALGVPDDRLADVMLVAMLIAAGSSMAAALTAGHVADRTGRRRGLVIGAALVMAGGLVIAAVAPTLFVFYLARGFVSFGTGAISPLQLSAAIDVLPDQDSAAKDLGIYNIANTAPQSIAPAVGPPLLAVFGVVSVAPLFLLGALCAASSAAAFARIRRVD